MLHKRLKQRGGGGDVASDVGTIEKKSLSSTAVPTKVIAKQFDNSPVSISAPVYRYNPLNADTSTSYSVGVNGTVEVTFKIAANNVFNFARSYIRYTRTIADQGNGNFVWAHANTHPEIQKVELKNPQGVDLLGPSGFEFANVWMKVTGPAQVKDTDFEHNDAQDPIYPSQVPALLNPLPVTLLGKTVASTNYTEQKYLEVSPVVGNGAGAGWLEKQVAFRLSSLRKTVVSCDKNMCFPDIMDLKITFSTAKGFWSTTSNVDPQTNAAALVAGTSTSSAVAPGTQFAMYLSGLQLVLAEETRTDVIDQMRAQLAAGPVKYYVPQTWVRKQQASSTSQTVTTKLSAAHGMFARSWVHVVMPNEETKNNAFDNSNTGAAAVPWNDNGGPLSDVGSKVTLFHHSIDNKQVEPSELRPTAKSKQDYIILRDTLRGSLINNPQQFYANWYSGIVWLPESPETGMLGPETLGGLDLMKAERQLDWVGSQMSGAGTLQHYDFITTTRILVVSKAGLSWATH